jgi:hypothetical protein
MKRLLLTTIASLATIPANAVVQPDGTAVAVLQAASANGTIGNRVLDTKGSVYTGDRIVTDAIGQVELLFRVRPGW